MRSLDLMCGGAKGDDCTPEKWYNFMGNVSSNKYVPFQINYITEPVNGYTPFNRSTVPCYDEVNVSTNFLIKSFREWFNCHLFQLNSQEITSKRCSCFDCSGSCSPVNWIRWYLFFLTNFFILFISSYEKIEFCLLRLSGRLFL